MTEQEKQAHDALIAEFKKQIDAAVENKVDSQTVATLKTQLEKLEAKESVSKEEHNAVKAAVVELETIIKAMKESGAKTEKLSVIDQIAKGLESNAEKLSVLKDRKGESISLTVKAAGTMSTGNVTAVGTNGLSMLLNAYEPGITPIPRSAPFFADLFSAIPTSGNTVSYAEMKNPDGGAGMTAEGAAKSQADFDLVEAKTNVRKITAYIKTSKEALDDIQALAGEINGELLTLVNLKKDSQVLLGDGTGQNLSGVLNQATAFAAGSFAASIDQANNYDVLVAAITQIQTAEVVSGEPAGFMANVIVMNPIDVAKMKLTKSTTGEYVMPVMIPGATTVMELPVIANARMTVDNFLVMDSTKGNLRIRESVILNVGYENDDFTKNLITILAEMRLAFYIKSQHVKAFVKGNFTTAKAALETA